MGRLLRGKIKETATSKTVNVSEPASNSGKTRSTVTKNKIADKQVKTFGSSEVNLENRCMLLKNNTENEKVKITVRKHEDVKNINEEAITADKHTVVDISDSAESDASSCPANITEKSKTTKKISNQIKLTKFNKTNFQNGMSSDLNDIDNENNPSSISKCGVIKESVNRSVLTDKTNSILKNNNSDSCEKVKSKVHFSSVNSIRKISQRRISDFFYSNDNLHHKIKEYPELETSQKDEMDLSDLSVLNESLEKLDQSLAKKINDKKKAAVETDLSKAVVQEHIPVYKQPVLNGRKSFRLTPPKVENKDTLYEFEVDENEQPRVNKKKRRPVKTYKKRKRVCVDNFAGKPCEFNYVPQRTMKLRTDQLNSQNNKRVRIDCHEEDVIEINLPNPRVSKSNNQHSEKICPKINGVLSVVNGLNKSDCHDKSYNIKKFSNCLQGAISSPAAGKEQNFTSEMLMIGSEKLQIEINGRKSCVNGLSINSRINDTHPISMNSVNPDFNEDKTQTNLLNYTYHSNSPLPELSRLHDGTNPVCNSSSINCSEQELDSNFMRGVTASTPFRAVHSPVRKHDFQVRLSGGELSNRFNLHQINDSDSDSEEFFGFRVNENHEDSIHDIHFEKTSVESEPLNNEPIQKISVREVISILKKNFGNDSKDEKKVSPLKALFYDNSLLTQSNDESSDASHDTFFSVDKNSRMNKFFTKNKETKKNRVQIEEPDVSFSKPPRRSYCITPRKKNVFTYREENEENSEDEDIQKKPPRKDYKNKPSKKQEKEMNKLAAMMNSQFQEVEKYQLVIE